MSREPVLPTVDPAAAQRLMEIGREARDFLLPRWELFWDEQRERGAMVPHIGASPSWNMCRFSSCFAAALLTRVTGNKWTVRGGSPFGECDLRDISALDGGMRDRSGQRRPHYWATDRVALLDLTADQFGWDPVLVTTARDPRYRANYRPRAVLEHLKDVEFRTRNWLCEWGEREAVPEPGYRQGGFA